MSLETLKNRSKGKKMPANFSQITHKPELLGVAKFHFLLLILSQNQMTSTNT